MLKKINQRIPKLRSLLVIWLHDDEAVDYNTWHVKLAWKVKYLVSLPLHFQQAVLCLQSSLLESYKTVASVLEDAWNIAGSKL